MKKIIIIIAVILVVIQFIPYSKPQVQENNPKDIIRNNDMSIEVQNILRTSCYDCHSNESEMPWYSYVAPVSWLVNHDINEGKEHMNFSEWEDLSKLKKAQIIDECVEEIQDGEMPLEIYTLIHRDAVLSKKQKEAFKIWAEDYADALFKKEE